MAHVGQEGPERGAAAAERAAAQRAVVAGLGGQARGGQGQARRS